jgi:hypothetical protein
MAWRSKEFRMSPFLYLIDEGAGPRQEERLLGLAWLAIELAAGEKLTNLVVTDCKTGLC